MLLTEIFSLKQQHFEFHSFPENFIDPGQPGYYTKFQVGQESYMFFGIQMTKAETFMDENPGLFLPLNNNTWFIGFTTARGDDGDTGTGNAIEVFNTAMAACDQFLKKVHPSIVYVGARKSSPVRLKIYRRMIKNFGGRIISATDLVVGGEDMYMWGVAT